MTAFGAAEETHLALVSSPELAQPPDGKIVLAFRALDLDGGHGFYFIVLVIHNRDLIFGPHSLGFHLVSGFDITDIPAFPALELTPGRDHHRLAFRTEHRYAMGEQRRLTLLSKKNYVCGFFCELMGVIIMYDVHTAHCTIGIGVPSESFFW